MQISLEQCKSGKFHVFANFCPKVDKLAGGDHFGPDIICAQAKRPRTLHYDANKTEQKEKLPIYVSMISYQFCDVNINVLHKHTFEAFYKRNTFINMDVLHCNKQGGLVG